MTARRTLTELAQALIPSRAHVVTAALVGAIYLGLTFCASMMHHVAPQPIADKASRFADSFMVMPVWVVLGNVVGQFGLRLNAAIDDVKAAYWGAE